MFEKEKEVVDTTKTDALNGGEKDILKEEEKSFTQSQVDEIVKTRLARALKNMPSREEVESFNFLKKENEENKELIKNLKDEAEKSTQRLLTYERRDITDKKGVNSKFGAFARFEAEKLMNDEIGFENALDILIAENPWLVSSSVLKTGLSQGGQKIGVSSLEESFYKRNPNLRD